MKPKIEATKFGSITISGTKYRHDVVIHLDGQVKKRKKKLSKQVYGTSHRVSLAEARQVYQEGAKRLIFGTGQYGMAELSDEAADFLEESDCLTVLLPTPEAIHAWNKAKGEVVGLFHVTC